MALLVLGPTGEGWEPAGPVAEGRRGRGFSGSLMGGCFRAMSTTWLTSKPPSGKALSPHSTERVC